ncbi:adenine deaminase [Candidatus Bathyarchaeota archaeon]|nr:MAG: adenine deaminase [Candidatus Bathyarchaeota archaeon]
MTILLLEMLMSSGDVKADLLIHGSLVNVYSGCISESYIGVKDGRIIYVGKRPISAQRDLDVGSKFILPAYIDGHVHIESSLVTPSQFAMAVIPRGTCCVVADPHEIANVCGVEGIKFMIEDSARTPLKIYFMIPSCVPATNLETSGAKIGLEEIEELKQIKQILGLGEVMNFPGVINSEEEIMAKIKSCEGMVIDGHAPGLRGEALCAYIAAGIMSDHESVTAEEAMEKLSLGMWVMIREGSTAKNLSELSRIVSKGCPERVMLVTDDRHADDLLTEGHLDYVLKRAVEEGIDPVDAVRMVTVKPAEYFGLRRLGAVSPGKSANIVIVDDLKEFKAEMVLIDGEIVAKKGEYLGTLGKSIIKRAVEKTVHIDKLLPEDFKVSYCGPEDKQVEVMVIEVVPDQIFTEKIQCRLPVENGEVLSDLEKDIVKICVVERHRGSRRIGKGFVKGFGLKKGALASTVAHDSHNIVAIGVSEDDICRAVNRIEEIDGGLVAVSGEEIKCELPLPIAGLMSDRGIGFVAERMDELNKSASDLGCHLRSPFMALSFLALPVIPKLKITDLGLVDVEKMKLIDLFVSPFDQK